jgi:hypothetical protein
VRSPRPQVDGQLGRRVRLQQAADALDRHQAAEPQRVDLAERRLDPPTAVDRDRDERQVLGEAQQPVGVQVLLGAEAADAPHHDARLQPVPGVDRGQRVGEEAAVGPLALAEVGGQLQPILAHSAPPT